MVAIQTLVCCVSYMIVSMRISVKYILHPQIVNRF